MWREEKVFSLFVQAVEKVSIEQKMNEYMYKMFRGQYNILKLLFLLSNILSGLEEVW